MQPHSAPTASNIQPRPRQRFSASSQQQVTGPKSATPRAPGVAVRPHTVAGTRPVRPPTGIARPTVIQNPSPASQGPVPRAAVGTQPARQQLSVGKFRGAPAIVSEVPQIRGSNPLPVPRRSMAPSRIAAILLRRQSSNDQVFTSYTLLLAFHSSL